MNGGDRVECSSAARWMLASLPAVLVAVIALFAVVTLRSGEAGPSGIPEVAAVDIAATGPRFDSLDELIAASDVIVEGQIVAVDDGRVITDPADPTSGFTTSLFQLDVAETFRGGEVDALIVEQEATLLDGTPIIVNGLTSNSVGDGGFWFLVRGGDEAFPYVALVNEQARLLVDGNDIGGLGADLNVEELRARLRG